MGQSHFTLSFPVKSHADAKALAEQLPPLMPGLFRAADVIGTIHYSRFTVLSEKTLLFLGDFDGEFGQLMADLAAHSGPVFDAIFQHVDNPPPTPVAAHADAFVEWTTAQLVRAVNLYTAYPDVTAKEIQALFAQFVPLEDNQIGFFTVYDGSFDKYIADFTKNIGEVFDLIFKFTRNPPPSPCRKHLQEFIDFAAGANRAPIGFYQAYPGLSVQDIHALIADSKSQSAPGQGVRRPGAATA
jgi:hypothetical protein